MAEESRVERRRAREHERLITVSTDLFAGRGFDNVSLDEISLASDLSRGTLYTHFTSKKELLREILEPILDHCLSALEVTRSLDPVSALETMLSMYLDLWKDNRSALKLSYQMSVVFDDAVAPVQARLDEFIGLMREVFQKLADGGLLRFRDSEVSGRIIHRIAIPLLEALENEPGWEKGFVESMKALILKSS